MTPINECSVHVCSTALSLQIPLQDRPAVVWSFAWSDPLSHGCSCTTNLVFSFKWKPPTFSTLAAMEVCGNLHQIYLSTWISECLLGAVDLVTFRKTSSALSWPCCFNAFTSTLFKSVALAHVMLSPPRPFVCEADVLGGANASD